MKILYPFSILYGFVIFIRNKLFDFGIFKQQDFNVQIISIGNLSLGGTGKTPHIEYFIKKFHSKNIAVISRGYGRKTKGFRIVNTNDSYSDTGDEPLQIKNKFKNIIVAVAEKRAIAIKNVLTTYPQTEFILLDDAFQHRFVKRDLNILLTDYHNPFWNDCVLPCGNLREFKSGYKRADLVIVTKCPEKNYLKIPEYLIKKPLFFSTIKYDLPIVISGVFSKKIIAVTGIANDSLFIEFLKNENYEILCHFKFSDHYNYKNSDIVNINSKLLEYENSMLLTTEKDFMRMKNYYQKSKFNIAYLPIKIEIENEPEDWFKFDKKALHLK